MALTAGTRVGVYEIRSLLGVGGMGEVYLARDTRLQRDVAVKVLPDEFAGDATRLARFDREARLLAALNHPNVAAIYGVEGTAGVPAIVMELVDGETLAERLAKGCMQVEEALPVAQQVCEGLEYAHERGIVHRDLKPANVKVTANGKVKLLDFGLARACAGESAREPSSAVSQAITLEHGGTRDGVILGTAAYMSPEQARGKPVDRRADIWAFGCLLYEMLAGRRAFHGETVTDVLAAVVRAEPDWSRLPGNTPPAIRALLERCLRKDPQRRQQSAGDARVAIEEAGERVLESTEVAPGPPPTVWRRLLPWVAGALFGAVLMSALTSGRAPSAPMHFRAVTNFAGVQDYPALSPDGRSVAFISNRDGRYDVYVGLVSGGRLVQVTNDANVEARPCWSPDGGTIAYARLNDSGLWDVWQVPALGGTSRRLVLNASDPTWSSDGRSLAYLNGATGTIWASDASGQNSRGLTKPLPPPFMLAKEPRFSPDGREVAFTARWLGPYGELDVVEVASGRVRQITHDNALAMSPAWSPDGGHIYFASSRGGTLNIWKIAREGGNPEQVTAGQGDDVHPDISADGGRIVSDAPRDLGHRRGGPGGASRCIASAGADHRPGSEPGGSRVLARRHANRLLLAAEGRGEGGGLDRSGRRFGGSPSDPGRPHQHLPPMGHGQPPRGLPVHFTGWVPRASPDVGLRRRPRDDVRDQLRVRLRPRSRRATALSRRAAEALDFRRGAPREESCGIFSPEREGMAHAVVGGRSVHRLCRPAGERGRSERRTLGRGARKLSAPGGAWVGGVVRVRPREHDRLSRGQGRSDRDALEGRMGREGSFAARPAPARLHDLGGNGHELLRPRARRPAPRHQRAGRAAGDDRHAREPPLKGRAGRRPPPWGEQAGVAVAEGHAGCTGKGQLPEPLPVNPASAFQTGASACRASWFA